MELPLLLDPQNFTPLTRTPWAGNYISQRFKEQIVASPGVKIGESWEFSCDPDFPSRLLDEQITVVEYLKQNRQDFFPDNPTANFEILLKIINAADDLSLQVHPDDENPNLLPNECGKPEAWLILDANAGAGIYLGFKTKIGKSELEVALAQGAAKELFQFVEVKPGDYFEIPAGVAHAIGKGVTLLEPQRVLFGKSGKTYRLWDWGRRYDEKGNLDMAKGKERPLHIKECLATIDPAGPSGKALLEQLQKKPKQLTSSKGLSLEAFPANSYSQLYIAKIGHDQSFSLGLSSPYAISLLLDGEISIESTRGAILPIKKGFAALWSSQIRKCNINAQTDSTLVFVLPHGAELVIY